MFKQRNQKQFWFLFSFLSFLYYFIHYQSPAISHYFYHQEGFRHLFKNIADTQTLDYYQGFLIDQLWGPLEVVLSGLLFLVFSLRFLVHRSMFVYGLAIFVYLVITRPEVLLYPPYADTLMRAFSDSIWLLRHNFDYASYLKQASFSYGGPQIYPTSIYPSFLAFLMRITPSPEAFLVIIHLITFAMAAFAVAIYRQILRKIFNEYSAHLVSILILSLPLFQSMAEAINMEMSCLFFAVFAVYYLVERKIPQASIMAVLSLLMKAPGGITCALVLMSSILLFIIDRRQKGSFANIFWGVGVFIFAAISFVIRSRLVGGKQIENNAVELFIGLPILKTKIVFWIFVFLMIVILGLGVWLLCRRKHKLDLKAFLNSNFSSINLLFMMILWFLFYINFSISLYRYQLLLMPFFIFCIIFLALLLIRNHRVVNMAIVMAIVLLLVNSYGLFFNKNLENTLGGNTFERSLEYRNDLLLHMKLAREIEENYSDMMISAPAIIAQTLNFKEVGYVHKPLDVMVYGIRSPHEGIKEFQGLDKIDIRKTIWVGLRVDMNKDFTGYPYGPKDLIVKKIEIGDKMATLFMGGYSVEKLRRLFQLKTKILLEKNAQGH